MVENLGFSTHFAIIIWITSSQSFIPCNGGMGGRKRIRDSAHCSTTRTGLNRVTQKGKELQKNLFLYEKEGVVPTYKRMHYTILVYRGRT